MTINYTRGWIDQDKTGIIEYAFHGLFKMFKDVPLDIDSFDVFQLLSIKLLDALFLDEGVKV